MSSLVNILIAIVLVKLVISAPDPSTVNGKISGQLATLLKNEEQVDIFIKMSEDTSAVLQEVTQLFQHSNRVHRLNSLHDQLVHHAKRTQTNVLEYLSQQHAENANFKVRSFWATNQIYVKGATRRLIEDVAANFPNEILSIYPDQIVAHIVQPAEVKNATKRIKASSEDELQWGLQKIQAREAWRELGKSNGLDTRSSPEIRIATLDTGVRHTHEALRDNFVGEYGWYDPTIGEPEPNDRMGHGSHTTATIVGSKGIGVAPWAKWMTCRGCPTLGCSMYDLLACGEFFVCPTLANGSSPDCSKAPHLVSNSWSGGQGLDWYNDIIAAWHAAGIIPVFSIGNFGNAFCGSANYPGDLPNVIAVGSTTIDDSLSWFSSIGPTFIGGSLIKPDIVAPGSDILSATNTADDDYVLMSGTSMSAPFVSGIVALLLTKNPQITFEEAKEAIVSTAQHDLQSRQLTCQGIPDTVYPNHVFGYGRVNALRSLLSLKSR